MTVIHPKYGRLVQDHPRPLVACFSRPAVGVAGLRGVQGCTRLCRPAGHRPGPAGLTTGAVYRQLPGQGRACCSPRSAPRARHIEVRTRSLRRRRSGGKEPREFLELLANQLVPPRGLRQAAGCSSMRSRRPRPAPRRPSRRPRAPAAKTTQERESTVLVDGRRAGRRPTAPIDPALDGRRVRPVSGSRLAMGRRWCCRNVETSRPPRRGAWHELIARLLDALSEELTNESSNER